ncbi:exosortase F system-associated membrane protein [Flavobacterium foetidum]|uniref:exosortase F system-associated membrane protein n=1 Tax=Flavobacterium foetidum TaxID=2026681 RepID=UPI00107504D5|nr:exosortase F system-associated protein [Flavobacterium foetidum]KAF2515950.1 exosortase F system-associated protein [Flavobacterium foetidum]
MLQKIRQNKVKIIIAIAVIFGFALIRGFENTLFYDPFLEFFKLDFKDKPFPEFDALPLFSGLLLRYTLNSGLSLILLYYLFLDKEILKFSLFLYLFFGLLLFGFFCAILYFFQDANWLLFYVRRFIIQPIFLLIFIPAFYYQLQYSKK